MIRDLDVNKAHDHYNILVKMINFCTNFVAHPLTLIFENSMTAGTFATRWKRANIVPIHKKNDKQIVSNYQSVSHLPICSKIFEKLTLINFPNFLRVNSNRGFARVIHIYQLLAITHDIFSSFDHLPTLETRGVFLDISKAFDRIWQDNYSLNRNKIVLVEFYFN